MARVVLLFTAFLAAAYGAEPVIPTDYEGYNAWFANLVRWNQEFHDGVRSAVLATTGHDLDKMMSRCYGDFGCFLTSGPWRNDLTRPVSLFPLPPEVIRPKYCLYTRRNPHICEYLEIDDPTTIYYGSYMPKGQVYFIIHGFIEGGERPWIKDLTAELLKRSACNVIVLDWKDGANPPYSQAVANIRLVGVMTAHLINMMVHEVTGLKAEKIHVIGHSLGSHVAGYIGTALRKSFGMKLGRITGLDPAEPHFAETDPIVRLDPSDAIFVDNIHTDACGFTKLCLGMLAPVGHVDFFANGGKNQPGCPKTFLHDMGKENGSFTSSVRNYLNCHHTRSYRLFIETVNKKLPTTAVECASYEDYLKGACFSCELDKYNISRCIPMGFHSILPFLPAGSKRRTLSGDPMLLESPKAKIRTMYSITGDTQPFYVSQFRVTVEVANETRDAGLLEISVIGENGETGFLPLESMKYLDGGSVQTGVVAGRSVGKIVTAALRWTHANNFFIIIRVNLPQISVHKVTLESLDHGERLELCANSILQSGYPATLRTC